MHLQRLHLQRHRTAAASRRAKHCLYAVFNTEEDARRAEQALVERSIDVHRPAWTEQSGSHSPHTMDAHGAMHAWHDLMRELNAKTEVWEIGHYAEQASRRHLVVVACETDIAVAQQIYPLLVLHGAYDIAYLGDWTVTYF